MKHKQLGVIVVTVDDENSGEMKTIEVEVAKLMGEP